jgi:hypothetical protein
LAPADLAKVCLTYLAFDVFETGACPDERAFEMRMKAHQFSDYAVQYWGVYVRGEGEKDPGVLDALLNLFKSYNKCRVIRQHWLWIADASGFAHKSPTSTPLHMIAQHGLRTVYNWFDTLRREDVELGMPNSRNDNNATPLHLAAMGGHVEMSELLLSKGANAAADDRFGGTPLHRASHEGHKDVVELLLSKGMDATVKDKFGATPLHQASDRGRRDVVELLLSKGADPGAKSESGWTPLHGASYGGHKDVVDLLLSKGADINGKNESGRTPLHGASNGGYKNVVELLLSKGMDATVKDKFGCSRVAVNQGC